MSKCANCEATNQPLVGDPTTPGIKMCGYRPGKREFAETVIGKHQGKSWTNADQMRSECLERRRMLDRHRYALDF